MLLKLTLMLLCSLIFIFCSGSFASSCVYKAVGERVEIQLGTEELPANIHLTWTHNKRKVYEKRGSNVKIHNLPIDHHFGFLILENIQKDQTGNYKGELYNNQDGKLIKKTEQQICVKEPVPEPTVTVECVEKGVNLTCSPVNSGEVDVSWMKNGEKSNTTSDVLHFSWSELKSGDTFTCTLSNSVSTKSRDVQAMCSDTGLYATTANEDEGKKDKEETSKDNNKKHEVTEKKLLFGFDLWWMLVILTGGASLLLILIVICVVCVCRCWRRNKRKAKEEAEFRLVSLMPDHTDQPDVPYMQKSESQRISKSLRPLPPLPSSRGPPAFQP